MPEGKRGEFDCGKLEEFSIVKEGERGGGISACLWLPFPPSLVYCLWSVRMKRGGVPNDLFISEYVVPSTHKIYVYLRAILAFAPIGAAETLTYYKCAESVSFLWSASSSVPVPKLTWIYLSFLQPNRSYGFPAVPGHEQAVLCYILAVCPR